MKALENLKQQLEVHDLKVCSIASPLFKWHRNSLNGRQPFQSYHFPDTLDYESKKSAIYNVVNSAQFFGARNVRIFSGLKVDFGGVNTTLDDPLFHLTLNEGVKRNINILIENEPICNIYTINHVKKILYELSDLKLWLDVSNFFMVKDKLRLNDLKELMPYIYHVHLKDFVWKNKIIRYVLLGEGCIPWNEILPLIKKIAPPGNYEHRKSCRGQ